MLWLDLGEGDRVLSVWLRRIPPAPGDPGESLPRFRDRKLSTRPGRRTGNWEGVPGESSVRIGRSVLIVDEDEMVGLGESSYPSATGDMNADRDTGTLAGGDGVPR